MWDKTPWFVDGADHSPEIARLLAYAATNGAAGIIGALDLKVAPLATPGTSVRVLPGACVVRNLAPSGAAQSYIARNPTEDVQPIAATGSSAKRSDLVAVIVEDPNVPGGAPVGKPYPVPADRVNAQYVFTRIIPNVPAGTTSLQAVPGYENVSGIALARIDLPVSTGTVTAGMIVDLRALANPRNSRTLQRLAVASSSLDQGPSTEVIWPGSGAELLNIPSWAVRLRAIATVYGAVQSGGNMSSEHRIRLGNASDPAAILGTIAPWDNDQASTARERVTLAVSFDSPIPDSMRGTQQPLAILGRRTTGPGILTSRGGTSAVLDCYFNEGIR